MILIYTGNLCRSEEQRHDKKYNDENGDIGHSQAAQEERSDLVVSVLAEYDNGENVGSDAEQAQRSDENSVEEELEGFASVVEPGDFDEDRG